MSLIGYAQFRPEFGNATANLSTIAGMAERAHSADLLVFPELCVSGYEFQSREECLDLAEPFGTGPTSLLVMQLATDLKSSIVVGYPERDNHKTYNSCMLALPDGILHNYRKIHLFDREKFWFSQGDAEPPVIETPAGRVGLMICFDWIFPEVARLLALKGAQVIAHPSNLVLPYCQRAMFARSVENRVYSITCNRYGTEDRAGRALTFTGASQVLSPRGEELQKAPLTEDHIGLVDIDSAFADIKQVTDNNQLFEDRRLDLFDRLLQR